MNDKIYEQWRAMKQPVSLPPHAESLPDHVMLTVMSPDRGWVLHLFMGDLRRLIALQPN